MSALNTQVGGDHYKKLKIQPVEYMHANGIPFIEGCIIKYASRWRDKGGIADLEKIKHFAQLLIDLELKAAHDRDGWTDEAIKAAAFTDQHDTFGKPLPLEPAAGIDDESDRASAIGQNGNDGLHYDADNPSWDDAPDWAMWLAQDSNGEWNWFECPIYADADDAEWYEQKGFNGRIEGAGESDERNENWSKTLQARPSKDATQ